MKKRCMTNRFFQFLFKCINKFEEKKRKKKKEEAIKKKSGFNV